MEVEVRGSIDAALLQLGKKLQSDGQERQTRIRNYPKRSVRRRFLSPDHNFRLTTHIADTFLVYGSDTATIVTQRLMGGTFRTGS